MKQYVFIIGFLLSNQVSFSQFDLFANPLKVDCIYSKKDTTIKINYKNITTSEIALWVGDFDIKYISENESYQYITSAIKNNIFFFKKGIKKNKFLNYFEIDDTLKYLYKTNYKILLPNESFTIIIKPQTNFPIRAIKKTKVILRYSLIDVGNLCAYLSNNKILLPGYKGACFFEEDKGFNTNNKIRINAELNYSDAFLKQKRIISKTDLPVMVPKIVSPELKNFVKYEGELIAPNIDLILKFHSAYNSEMTIKN